MATNFPSNFWQKGLSSVVFMRCSTWCAGGGLEDGAEERGFGTSTYLPTQPATPHGGNHFTYVCCSTFTYYTEMHPARPCLKCKITRFLLLSRHLRANLTILMLALIFIPVKAVSGLIFGTFVR